MATAGSCFAQHIARHLRQAGLNYFVTETGNPFAPPDIVEKYGYGVFTARYGNIYTSRQLLQTIQRAYGVFEPIDDKWTGDGDCIVDPFRPRIQPGGFISIDEFELDREQHFCSIRDAIEHLDVLVFTLGLTETWFSRTDGAVFPICPGVAGGEYDETRYGFVNLTVADVVADLKEAIRYLRSKNPSCRVILTVSPVPLAATAIDRSVLVSTVYSKSVLRVAAEEIAALDPGIAYFPSYEVITGTYNRGSYFAQDLRSVTEAGVSHVMRLFLKHYAKGFEVHVDEAMVSDHDRNNAVRDSMGEALAVVCEEESLANF